MGVLATPDIMQVRREDREPLEPELLPAGEDSLIEVKRVAAPGSQHRGERHLPHSIMKTKTTSSASTLPSDLAISTSQTLGLGDGELGQCACQGW